ncbi:MAG: DUF502 domain-containing protein [Deltaproteobacteria bacterium]|nr:DUF502 domain-containing protein [Deltaproteobacteria bacterium]
MNFIKTTLIGGLIFLVPLIVLIVVIGQAIGVLIVVAEPIAELIPAETVAGIALVNLIALGAVILLCFLAGLVARSAAARKLTDMAESKVLQKIPGYTIIKGIASGISPYEDAHLTPVLVTFDDCMRFGLEVERIGEERVVVYFPGSPNAWSGIVNIVMAKQVRPVDVPIMSVFEHAERLGKGAHEMLAGELQSAEARSAS